MNTRAYMSFGAGVQSTAIAMLAINRDERLLRATGGIVPELYIFADTGDEPKALYPHVADMRVRIEASGAKFAIVTTPLGKLSDHIMHAVKHGFARAEQLPFWVAGKDGRFVPVQRRCTAYFKIKALKTYATYYFGVNRGAPHGGGRVKCWLGISADEPQRLKAGMIPDQEWAEYSNPLFDMRWHRADCITYLNEIGVRAARSACVYCPFHSRSEWREVAKDKDAWALVLKLDEQLEAASTSGRHPLGFKAPLFLNSEGVRMRDYDLSQSDDPQQRLWDNECAGVCGV